MKKEQFSTLNDLYNRVKPALNCKVTEIKRNNINYITNEDVWNCLKLNIWNYKNDLTLEQMVDDILNTPIESIDYYVKKEMSKYKRNVLLDNESTLL